MEIPVKIADVMTEFEIGLKQAEGFEFRVRFDKEQHRDLEMDELRSSAEDVECADRGPDEGCVTTEPILVCRYLPERSGVQGGAPELARGEVA